jgi:hypothetical protein
MLSGRNSVYAVANRILPPRVGAQIVARLKQRPVETVFETHYDSCTDTGLRQVFRAFEDLEVLPYWRAANYFDRLRALEPVYLMYENWAADGNRRDLATHYVVTGRRAAS